MATITQESKTIIIAALRSYRGDDYERAAVAFCGRTPEQMQEQHGQSGKTRQAILDGYKAHVEAVERAVAEVVSL